MLTQLPDGFTAVVTGAGGGIGSAVIDALLGERTAEESGSFYDWAGEPVAW